MRCLNTAVLISRQDMQREGHHSETTMKEPCVMNISSLTVGGICQNLICSHSVNTICIHFGNTE